MLDFVLRISLNSINNKGLQIHARLSQRHPAKYLTDLDFADDTILISELVENSDSLLQSLDKAARVVGLHCNETKTEYISTTKTLTSFVHSQVQVSSKLAIPNILGHYKEG